MIRIPDPLSVCDTTTSLCPNVSPIRVYLFSESECYKSGMVIDRESPNAELASSNETLCFALLGRALA